MSFRKNKNVQAVNFFIRKTAENKINRLKLIKLLWLADRIHLNKYGRFILKDEYYALPHGPVALSTMDCTHSSTSDIIRKENKYSVISLSEFDEKFFSLSDIEILDLVWEKYGDMPKFRLRDLSHNFPEWKRFEKELDDDSMPNRYRMVVEDFFENPNVSSDYYPVSNKEIEEGKKEYLSHSSIKDILS